MGKTISALAARVRTVDFKKPLAFTILFTIPMDYIMPHVNFVPIFSFIFWLIVKEDAETQLIDIRLAACLAGISFLITGDSVLTFAFMLGAWFFFKTVLYITTRFENPEKPTPKEETTVEEGREAATASEPCEEECQNGMPLIPYFAGGIFLTLTAWMLLPLPIEETQKSIESLLTMPIMGIQGIPIGASMLPPVVIFFLTILFLAFLASYARYRYELSKGKEARSAFGDGDPIILAIFFGILPFLLFLIGYTVSLVFAMIAILRHRRN